MKSLILLLAAFSLSALAQDSSKSKPTSLDTAQHVLTIESLITEWNSYIGWTEERDNYFVYDWRTGVNIHPQPSMSAFILWLSKKYKVTHPSVSATIQR